MPEKNELIETGIGQNFLASADVVLDQRTDVDLSARPGGSAMTVVVISGHVVARLEESGAESFKTSRMLAVTMGNEDMPARLIEVSAPS